MVPKRAKTKSSQTPKKKPQTTKETQTDILPQEDWNLNSCIKLSKFLLNICLGLAALVTLWPVFFNKEPCPSVGPTIINNNNYIGRQYKYVTNSYINCNGRWKLSSSTSVIDIPEIHNPPTSTDPQLIKTPLVQPTKVTSTASEISPTNQLLSSIGRTAHNQGCQ